MGRNNHEVSVIEKKLEVFDGEQWLKKLLFCEAIITLILQEGFALICDGMAHLIFVMLGEGGTNCDVTSIGVQDERLIKAIVEMDRRGCQSFN